MLIESTVGRIDPTNCITYVDVGYTWGIVLFIVRFKIFAVTCGLDIRALLCMWSEKARILVYVFLLILLILLLK